MTPNRRYLDGLTVSVEDSRDFGDPENDYLIRRFFICTQEARQDDGASSWEMIMAIEIEVCDIDKDGVDQGHLESYFEVYRVPFPQDSKLRKNIIRLCLKHPKFFLTDTFGRPTQRWLSSRV